MQAFWSLFEWSNWGDPMCNNNQVTNSVPKENVAAAANEKNKSNKSNKSSSRNSHNSRSNSNNTNKIKNKASTVIINAARHRAPKVE